MKKNKKIIVAIIVFAILILIVGIALAFVLKNNKKEEFFKLAAQIFDSESGFIDNKLEQYNKKKESNAFENKGKITFNVPTENLDSKTANIINNEFSVSFMGNVDNANEKIEELIRINYNNNNNFPMLYKKVGSTQAFKLTRIMQKYIGSKESNIFNILGIGQNNEVIEKAQEASKRNDLAAAKDYVFLKIQDITLDVYDSIYVKKTEDESKFKELYKEKIFNADFQKDKVKITIEEDENEKNIGKIVIVLEEDKNYACIGTINSSGTLEWKDEMETYKADEIAQNEIVPESNVKLSEDEIKQLIEKNINDIKEIIDEKSISKVSNSDSEGYSLELSYEKIKEIINLVADNIKNDEKLLKSLYLDSNKLDTIVSYCNKSIPTEGKIIITIYKYNNKVNRINIIFDDVLKLDIKENEQDNELSYDINLNFSKDNNEILAKVVIGYTGLNSLEKVIENYNIGLDLNGNNYTYNIENTVNFTDVEISNFEDNDYVDIQKYSSAKLSQLMQTIWKKVLQVNTKLMEQSQITSPEDFWYNLIPKTKTPGYNEEELNNFFEDEELDIEENDKNKENSSNTSSKKTDTTITNNSNSDSNTNTNRSDDLATSFSEVEKNSFNSKYLAFEGNSVSGSDLKKLMMQIIANNMADEERQIKVSGDIKLTGNEVPDGIDNSKTYTVSFKKSNDGYINESIIKENA